MEKIYALFSGTESDSINSAASSCTNAEILKQIFNKEPSTPCSQSMSKSGNIIRIPKPISNIKLTPATWTTHMETTEDFSSETQITMPVLASKSKIEKAKVDVNHSQEASTSKRTKTSSVIIFFLYK